MTKNINLKIYKLGHVKNRVLIVYLEIGSLVLAGWLQMVCSHDNSHNDTPSYAPPTEVQMPQQPNLRLCRA